MVFSIISALKNKIGNSATIIEKHVLNNRVATINYNSFIQVRKRAGIFIIGDAVPIRFLLSQIFHPKRGLTFCEIKIFLPLKYHKSIL